MNGQSKHISIADELSSVEEEISDILDEAEDLDADSEEFEEKDIQYKALRVQKDNLENILESLDDDGEFEIRELSFGELMHVRDDVLAVSDGDNPREGLYRVKVMELAVEDSPDALSDEPKDWPPVVAEWVYDEVDSMNTGVDTESLGNYSLETALEEETQ